MTFQTKAAILCIGSELLEGRILNSNFQWLAKNLYNLGFKISAELTCDDIISDIVSFATTMLINADLLILTGGLGPTSDDLTREAVSKLVGKPLEENAEALENIKDFFSKRGRNLKQANLRQALVPQDSVILKNLVGTAPGFCLKTIIDSKEKFIISMPGPPLELQEMFKNFVIPIIESKEFNRNKFHQRFLRVFGIPESTLGEIINSLTIPNEVEVAYRYSFPIVQILFKSFNESKVETALELTKNAVDINCVISETEDLSLAELVHSLLLKNNKTISFAESCTGGLISKMLTDLPGSSAYLLGSAVTYSNQSKTRVLNVDPSIIKENGAVSSQTAKSMAIGASSIFDSQIAVSVTGIAGPDGGSAEKPVGSFYIGLNYENKVSAHQYFFPSTRKNIRLYAAHVAL
ncbi:MAG: competence/damage-inducible protein A, partial [Bdellovibrionales bacterium]|nr:competence/damage-inducible protein A [Bdellovibrionales bacterium]